MGIADTGGRRVTPPVPLLPAFELVRTRIPRLGVPEYLLALRALDGAVAVGSRAELLFLLQAIWAKSPDEQRIVADVLQSALPEAWDDEEADLRELVRDLPNPEAAPAGPVSSGDVERPGPARRLPREGAARGESGRRGTAPVGVDARTIPVSPLVRRQGPRLRPGYDLEGSLPVTRRQMSRAWRSYRRMARQGVPIEFDAVATVSRLYQQGVLDRPVLVPARTNQARALILADVGGSMVPFEYVTGAFLHAGRHAGLARVEVCYFHDVPGAVVFRDPARLNPVSLEAAVAPFQDAGVLIYSDAGAARGALDETRVEHTRRLLEVLRRHTSAIAWLNPVPSERWRGTTAGAIHERLDVPMFTFDRGGLTSAVDVMRGRGS